MGGRQPQGFTIIEIMIFLAVSGFIFMSAMILMSGKQDRTEFSTGIAQLTSQLQNIASNVAGGYYSIPNNFSCTAGANTHPSPSFSGSVNRGSNFGCIFIGEVLQFEGGTAVGTSNQPYMIYPIIGNQFQYNTQNEEVTNLAQTYPYYLYNSAVPSEDQATLPYGMTVSYMDYVDGSLPSSDQCVTGAPTSSVCINAVGIFTTFNGKYNTPQTGSVKLLQNGSQAVDIDPIPPVTGNPLTENQSSMFAQIEDLSSNNTNNSITDTTATNATSVSNPSGGVQICFNSGSNSESGLMTIGGSNSSTLVSVQIFSQKGCVG